MWNRRTTKRGVHLTTTKEPGWLSLAIIGVFEFYNNSHRISIPTPKAQPRARAGAGGGIVGHVQKQPRAFADRGLRPSPPQVRWPSVSVSDIHIYVFLYVLLTRHNSPNSDIKPNSDKIIFGLNAP